MSKSKVAIPLDGYVFKPQGYLEKNDLIWNGVKFQWDSFAGSLSFMLGRPITKAMTVCAEINQGAV